MLTQSCYKVKALFNPMNSVCLISLTTGGYFFLRLYRSQTSFVGIEESKLCCYCKLARRQQVHGIASVGQDTGSPCMTTTWPSPLRLDFTFLMFCSSSCFLLSPWPLILSRHHLVPQESVFISISDCLSSFYGCSLYEFTLSPILSQEKAWGSKINREVQEK